MDLNASDFMGMYKVATARESGERGHYHRNVRVDAHGSSFVVRIPVPGVQVMDLAPWREDRVVGSLHPWVRSVPRLLFVHEDPYFQVQNFLPGKPVAQLYPAGRGIPDHLAGNVASFFADLLSFPVEEIPELPTDWPAGGDVRGFSAVMVEFGRALRLKYGEENPRLFADLDIPYDPFEALEREASRLTMRPFRLLHGDMHRGNMLVEERRTSLLDWQLAAWGDPVYDLADHLHKMGYTRSDERRAVADWIAVAPEACRRGWRDDLEFYLRFQRIKSAVVDTVRWSRRISSAPPRSTERRDLVLSLTATLARARPYWSTGAVNPMGEGEVLQAVLRSGSDRY
ncbi:phosphotransferase family protein [uncultured Streptomyces sp.]|uniref:phosphotransferase family protein n=1 Tax=uncultured Streptomyces sp. TaxID=174707 RepID=UPI00261D8BFF|nr:aminoglycoside phosphotransferase family protein [uncultured Streptomyces sp.]